MPFFNRRRSKEPRGSGPALPPCPETMAVGRRTFAGTAEAVRITRLLQRRSSAPPTRVVRVREAETAGAAVTSSDQRRRSAPPPGRRPSVGDDDQLFLLPTPTPTPTATATATLPPPAFGLRACTRRPTIDAIGAAAAAADRGAAAADPRIAKTLLARCELAELPASMADVCTALVATRNHGGQAFSALCYLLRDDGDSAKDRRRRRRAASTAPTTPAATAAASGTASSKASPARSSSLSSSSSSSRILSLVLASAPCVKPCADTACAAGTRGSKPEPAEWRKASRQARHFDKLRSRARALDRRATAVC